MSRRNTGLLEKQKEKRDKSSSRRLRSKDEINKDPNHALFNFENINELLYRDQPIKVSADTSFDNLYKYNNDVDLPPPQKLNKTTNLEITKDLLPRKSKHSEDVLPDIVYESFHRKMRKEEKIMANVDRLRILSEVDTLHSSLQLLHQYDWIRHLPSITYIKDIRDYGELDKKKDLTITEIERLLRKHDDWKKRQELLNNDTRTFDNLQEEEGEVDEYILPIDQLRQRRLDQRRESLGPVIKLRLNNGYALIIDPLLPPKIIKSESSTPQLKSLQLGLDMERKAERSELVPESRQMATSKEILRLKEKMGSCQKVLSNYEKSLNPQSVRKTNIKKLKISKEKPKPREKIMPIKLQDVPSDFVLSFKSDDANGIAFGNEVPDLGDAYTDFEISHSWKRKAHELIHHRENLRRKLAKQKYE